MDGMKNAIVKNIRIDTNSRYVHCPDRVLGVEGEDLVTKLVFSFTKFVDGTPKLEVIQGCKKYFIDTLEKVDNTYQLTVLSSLLTTPKVLMNLRINDPTGEEIFKSTIWEMFVIKSINATEAIPEQYPNWVDETDRRLDKLESAAAGDKNYYFQQTVPSDRWVINHNLLKYPAVNIMDSGGNNVMGDIEYIDLNNLVITFKGAFSGNATLN